MFTSTAISAIRTFLKNSISFARYKIGSTYHDAAISSAEVLEDGRVAIAFEIAPSESGTETITEIQLMDYNGVAWVTSTESITRNAETGNYYLFRARIIEV